MRYCLALDSVTGVNLKALAKSRRLRAGRFIIDGLNMCMTVQRGERCGYSMYGKIQTFQEQPG